ncbi:MAG TPA: S9 family peptidase [Bacteroidetes bacterium]|nr:S9 family peptidase [Bacteroidota bacterium]
MKLFRFVFIIILSFFLLFFSVAQKPVLNLKEAIVGPYKKFKIQDIKGLQWIPGEHELARIAGDSLVVEDPVKGKKDLLFMLDELNLALKIVTGDSLSSWPEIHWKDENTLWFSHDTTWVQLDVKDMNIVSVVRIPKGGQHADYCPENPAVAFTLGQNIYISELGKKIRQLSFDSLPGIVNGQIVSRNEFGITKGTFWSSKGNYLAWYRKDESRVSQYPLVDIRSRVARLKNIRYPMAGMESEEIHLFVYDRKNKKTREIITPGPYDQYLTNVAWSPDEKYLFIAVLTREQDHMWLNMYDVQTGKKVRTLFEEKNIHYVEPLHPVRFLPEHPGEFIWQSSREGYNQVFLYDTTGRMIRNLTPGKYDVTNVLGFSDHDLYMYYVSTEESPLQRHIYRVGVITGKKKKLTVVDGTHQGILSPDGKYLIDRYSNLETPRIIEVINAKGEPVKRLLTAGNPWEERRLGRVILDSLPAEGDSPVLYYRLIKPVNFDPAKKYPVVVYVYGGPHSQLVTDSWLGQSRMWQHYMAGQGYVSLTMDNRGTRGRGFDFESSIHRHLGDYEVKDQMRGIKYLKSLPYVDTTRIGVHGWSYGGFMTISMMLKNPGVFKAAVAGGPVTDWKYYEVMYGERYMDRPQENPEGYAEADLKNYVDNLKGHLLIIHGAMDSTVVWQHSLTLLRAFISRGKQVDYFVYPTSPHNVRGYDRIHLMRKVSDYFDEYLKTP